MKNWLTLILSLPTQNATARMRAWRSLKASGAAVLRDGVYLLPDTTSCQATLSAIAADVQAAGGTAYLLPTGQPEQVNFAALFDRSEEHASLLAVVGTLQHALTPETASEALKQARKLRKQLLAINAIDFFPGEAQRQADAALLELERTAGYLLSPDEPRPADSAILALDPKAYRGKTWATRRRPWVDRLASAWLIRRGIDPKARILWLASPAECPAHALGFDFDGARFSHVGAKVSFEVLLASFGFDDPSLQRLGALVHYLDVGGIQPAEAAGVESVLAGLRAAIDDDDQLLQAAGSVFDGLLAAFQKESPTS